MLTRPPLSPLFAEKTSGVAYKKNLKNHWLDILLQSTNSTATNSQLDRPSDTRYSYV